MRTFQKTIKNNPLSNYFLLFLFQLLIFHKTFCYTYNTRKICFLKKTSIKGKKMNITKTLPAMLLVLILNNAYALQPALIITNKMSVPVIINFYVNTQSNAGSFGLLIEAQSEQKIEIPEFYWFDKQAVGGFRQPGQPSKVKIVDVLKHSYANTLDITIPNDQFYSFFIKPETQNVVISAGESTAKVSIAKAIQ